MSAGSTGPEGHFGSVDQSGGGGAAGPWPGFDPSAPPPIAATSSTGAATTAARGDHTHEGVHSVNGLLGDVFVNGVATLDSVNTTGAKLSALASATLTAGALAFVVTVGAVFQLQQSALTVDNITVVTASGKAGYQWVRMRLGNLVWQARTAWFVDPANVSGAASDENTGASALLPLASWGEHARRVEAAYYTANITTTAMSSVASSGTIETPSSNVFYNIQGTGAFSVNGSGLSGTPIYSGTVTGYTAQAGGPAADDNELVDTTIPSSFTASGLLANGLICKRTNSTALYWYIAKDLGSKTARISDPFDVNTTAVSALSVNDTYSVYALTVVPILNFPNRPVVRDRMTEVSMLVINAAYTKALNLARVFSASGSSWASDGSNLLNCAFDCAAAGTGPSLGPGITTGFMRGGMVRGTANAVVTSQGSWTLAAITFQGCYPQANTDAFLTIQGRISVFDISVSSLPCLSADYWSSILFFHPPSLVQGNSCVSGKGNTGPVLSALNWSSMAYTTGIVPAVDATTSLGNSIQLGATTTNVAALPINNLSTTGIGIYASA